MTTKIMYCSCKSEFMDSRYGEGKRVYNKTTIQEGKVFRCVCCGNEKSSGESDDSKKNKKKGK